MKEILLKQKEKAFNFWNRLSSIQKILFGSGTVIIILGAVLLMVFVSRPNYVPLYTDLDPQDAAAITEYLKEQKVLYKLEDSGSTILVPQSQKYDLRLSLAHEGIPKGGSVGFESFDKSRFGETESERRVRYLVALQGELERTIRKLDSVEDVRVHIVVPEPSLFLEKEKDATAAVLVKLRPGSDLEDEQVNGIINLVASGVEGLKQGNVTVVDTGGNILSSGLDGSTDTARTTGLTAKQHQVEHDYEKEIENSLREMLDQIVGQGKTVVRAHATLDFDQVEIHRETFGDKTIRSQEIEEEHTSENGPSQGGVPGSDSNIPGDQYQEEEGGTAGSTSQTSRKITNYEIDQEAEHRVVAPGAIKQLSLSVVLDVQPDTIQQNEITDLVTAAVGLDPERGDKLTVTCMPFDRGWAEKMEKELVSKQKRQQLLYFGAAAVVLLILLMIAAVIMSRRRRDTVDLLDYSDGRQPTVEEVLGAQEEEMPEEEREKARIVENIKTQVKQQPDRAAELIKTWLGDDQR